MISDDKTHLTFHSRGDLLQLLVRGTESREDRFFQVDLSFVGPLWFGGSVCDWSGRSRHTKPKKSLTFDLIPLFTIFYFVFRTSHKKKRQFSCKCARDHRCFQSSTVISLLIGCCFFNVTLTNDPFFKFKLGVIFRHILIEVCLIPKL